MRNLVIVGLLIIGLCGTAAGPFAQCSSVCLDKKGQLLLGNNADWFCGDGMVVVNKRHVVKRGFWYANRPDWTWTSRYGSITVNMEGREFPIRGMNEAGLAIVEMSLPATQYPPSDSLPFLGVGQWIQYQLDNSATVKEVIASETVVRIPPEESQSHFLICDSSGSIACIEWLEGKLTVHTDTSLPIPALVNSTYESCITNGDDPSGRFRKIADMLAAYDTAQTTDGVGYVFSILQQVANEYYPPFLTQWRVLYDVRAMRCYWKTITNSLVRYVDFKDFDFTCQTDVEVLDINSADTGHVRTAFVPYTIAFNRDMVTRTYTLYNQYSYLIGRQYSEDTINGIINFPDSTFCEAGVITRIPRSSMTGGCRVYVLPKSTSVHIVLPEPVSNRIAISLFDIRGRAIASGVENTAKPVQIWIIWELPIITRGIYYCKIIAGENSYVRPLIIQ